MALDNGGDADNSIFEAGGGWVRSLGYLRNSVSDAENELPQTSELVSNLRRDERDLLERQTSS